MTCNAVAPGFVLTELTTDLNEDLQRELTERTPLGRLGNPEEIADAVAYVSSGVPFGSRRLLRLAPATRPR